MFNHFIRRTGLSFKKEEKKKIKNDQVRSKTRNKKGKKREMETRKRVFNYDEENSGKRHQGDDHGHLSRQRAAESRSLSPKGAPRSRSMSPNGDPPPRYPRGSPRGGHRGGPRGGPRERERSFSPGPQGNGDGRSKVCHFWRQSDSCKFGTQCHFAHSMSGIRGRISPSPMEGPPQNRGDPHLPKQYQMSPDRNGGPPGGRRGGRNSADRGPPMRRGGPMRPRSRSPHGGPGGRGGFGGPGGPGGRGGGPMMRGPTVCHFWKNNDNCKFEDRCKFLHSFPEPGAGPPPRRDFPPPGRPGRRSFSPPRQNFPPRPRMSPGRDGGRPIVWNHDVSPRQQRYNDFEPNRNFSPPRHPRAFSPPRRERSMSPRRFERGPSPRSNTNFSNVFSGYMSPGPRGGSPGRYHSPPRRGGGGGSPRFDRGRSPQPRFDGHGSPRGRRDHFSPPTQYRGQPGPKQPGRKREICYFFTQKQGCRNADQCNFIHSKPAEGGERPERPARRERPPRGEGSSPASRDSSPA